MSKTGLLLVTLLSAAATMASAQQYGGNVNNAGGTIFRSGSGLCWGVGSGNANAKCDVAPASPTMVAQAAATAAPSKPAGPAINNWVSGTGIPVKNGGGDQLCWRDGFWTPDTALEGCGRPAGAAPTAAAPAPAPAAPAPAPAAPTKSAPAAPAAAPVAGVEKVTYQADAFFDFDKSVLKPEGKAKLDDLSQKIAGIKLEVIVAVGHTDSIGSDAYNDKLSLRRAEAVKAYLVGKGVDASRIYTEGKGERQPVASNKTKEGRAQNRRVEIEVVGTQSK